MFYAFTFADFLDNFAVTTLLWFVEPLPVSLVNLQLL